MVHHLATTTRGRLCAVELRLVLPVETVEMISIGLDSVRAAGIVEKRLIGAKACKRPGLRLLIGKAPVATFRQSKPHMPNAGLCVTVVSEQCKERKFAGAVRIFLYRCSDLIVSDCDW